MTRPVAQVVVDTGIVDPDALAQLQRWGYLHDIDLEGDEVVSAREAAERILEAVESHEAVELRSTDLDIIKQYLASRKKGRLHVVKDGEIMIVDEFTGRMPQNPFMTDCWTPVPI